MPKPLWNPGVNVWPACLFCCVFQDCTSVENALGPTAVSVFMSCYYMLALVNVQMFFLMSFFFWSRLDWLLGAKITMRASVCCVPYFIHNSIAKIHWTNDLNNLTYMIFSCETIKQQLRNALLDGGGGDQAVLVITYGPACVYFACIMKYLIPKMSLFPSTDI